MTKRRRRSTSTGVIGTPTWALKKRTTRCVLEVEQNFKVCLSIPSLHFANYVFICKLNKRQDFSPEIVINCFIRIVQGLMRELELREKKVNDIQAMGDKFVKEGHPGKKTVEVISLVNSADQWKSSYSMKAVIMKVRHEINPLWFCLLFPCRPSLLPCKLSGAGFSSCAAALRLISKKTQPTTRFGAIVLIQFQFQYTCDKHLEILEKKGVIFFLPHDVLLLQFFADVKDAQDKMKKMQENMKKKYSCDRSTTATRLEDLLQDAVVSDGFLHWYI